MKTLLQVNVTANWGAHGKIAEAIGKRAMAAGWRSVIAFGRMANSSESELIRIGSDFGNKEHWLESRLFDNHGLSSRFATKALIKKIEGINPNIIHLHNIHGYYLNYKLLFEYLASVNIPIVWTLHDCWLFTGHCAYFEFAGCERWREGCYAPCPCLSDYPKSALLDQSKRNWVLKNELFNSVDQMTLVPVSDWLGNLVKKSFLKKYPVDVIHNGIDLEVFRPSDDRQVRQKYGIGNHNYVLGVASDWAKRKGLFDFYSLTSKLDNRYKIVLVGLNKQQLIEAKVNGIIGIPRTENVGELTALYSGAEVFLNLTYEDNYPTTNLEAMACGTPVLTYKSGGSPEAVSDETGWILSKGNLDGVASVVETFGSKTNAVRKACRLRAESFFDKNVCFENYLKLYENILSIK